MKDDALRIFIKNLVYFGQMAGEMDEAMISSHLILLKEILNEV